MDIDTTPSTPSGPQPEAILPTATDLRHIRTFDNYLYVILKPNSVYIATSYYPKLERFGWSIFLQVSKSDTNHIAYYSVEPPKGKDDERVGPEPEPSQWRVKHITNDIYPFFLDGRTPLIVGFVRVAALDPSDTNGSKVDKIIRLEDSYNFAEFNQLSTKSECVYVSRICERLKTAGMMTFNKWDDVEYEVFSFGEKMKGGLLFGNNERFELLPTMDSVVCGLGESMELSD